MKEFYGTEEYFEQKVSSFLSKEGDEKTVYNCCPAGA